MHTTPISTTLRTALKRLIRTRSILLVNTNGDLYDFETLIRLNPDIPQGTWHAVTNSDIPKLLSADALTTDEEVVSIQTGVRTNTLTTEPYDNAPTPPALDTEADTLTLRSTEGRNHIAMKVLATTASADDTLPALTSLYIDGNTADGDNAGDSADRYMPTGTTTDRYQATIATLTAEPSPVTAMVASRFLQETAKRSGWTMTVTSNVTSVEYDDIGIVVTAKNLTDSEFPNVRNLFPGKRESQASVCVRPKELGAALKSLAVERNAPAVLTSDGTVYADETPEVHLPEAHTYMRGDASPTIGLAPASLMKQCKAVGPRWDDVLISWGERLKLVSLSYGHGIEGIIMPTRHSDSRPGTAGEEATTAA